MLAGAQRRAGRPEPPRPAGPGPPRCRVGRSAWRAASWTQFAVGGGLRRRGVGAADGPGCQARRPTPPTCASIVCRRRTRRHGDTPADPAPDPAAPGRRAPIPGAGSARAVPASAGRDPAGPPADTRRSGARFRSTRATRRRAGPAAAGKHSSRPGGSTSARLPAERGTHSIFEQRAQIEPVTGARQRDIEQPLGLLALLRLPIVVGFRLEVADRHRGLGAAGFERHAHRRAPVAGAPRHVHQEHDRETRAPWPRGWSSGSRRPTRRWPRWTRRPRPGGPGARPGATASGSRDSGCAASAPAASSGSRGPDRAAARAARTRRPTRATGCRRARPAARDPPGRATAPRPRGRPGDAAGPYRTGVAARGSSSVQGPRHVRAQQSGGLRRTARTNRERSQAAARRFDAGSARYHKAASASLISSASKNPNPLYT